MSTQKRVDIQMAQYLETKLIPQLWRALHSALAQGAFLTITFAVMAGVARVSALLAPAVPKPQKLVVTETAQIEDLGEAVHVTLISSNANKECSLETPMAMEPMLHSLQLSETPPKHPLDPKKTKQPGPQGSKPKRRSKNKKKLDAIDAIFG